MADAKGFARELSEKVLAQCGELLENRSLEMKASGAIWGEQNTNYDIRVRELDLRFVLISFVKIL